MHRRSPLIVSRLCFLAYAGMLIGRNDTIAAVYPPKVAKEIEEEQEEGRQKMLITFTAHATMADHALREYAPPPSPFLPRGRRRDIHRAKIPKYSNQKRYVF